jgi:hypothetical protein
LYGWILFAAFTPVYIKARPVGGDANSTENNLPLKIIAKQLFVLKKILI